MPLRRMALRAIRNLFSLLTARSVVVGGVRNYASVYHTEYPADFYTALYRWDHNISGAEFPAGTDVDSGAADAIKHVFLQVSEEQVAELENHHTSVLSHDAPVWPIKMVGQTIRLYSSQYLGTVHIGTLRGAACLHEGLKCVVAPLLKVRAVFDTGSTNFWVMSSRCHDKACQKPDRHLFNEGASGSWQQRDVGGGLIQIKFGTGSLSGHQGADELRIGPLRVVNQTVGLIDGIAGEVFETVPMDALLGMAFPAMAANAATPFFDNVIEQKLLSRNEFSFYLSKYRSASSLLLWGGVNPDLYTPPIEMFPVTDPYYWSIDLNSFKIGNEEFLGPTSNEHVMRRLANNKMLLPKAILDTGTSFLTAEGYLIERVLRRLSKVPCSSMTLESHPDITYELVSPLGAIRPYVLSHNEYMVKSKKGECSPAFMHIEIPPEHGPGMVLGEVWGRKYFTTYSRGDGGESSAHVGFAEAKDGEFADESARRLGTETNFAG